MCKIRWGMIWELHKNSGTTKNFLKLLGECSHIGKVKFGAPKPRFGFAREVEGNMLVFYNLAY